MFNNCYRPGCHFDMNRCCHRNYNCWNNDFNQGYNREFKCCFPIEINFNCNRRENKKEYDRKEDCDRRDHGYNNFENENYDYGYENNQNNDFNGFQNNQNERGRGNQDDCNNRGHKEWDRDCDYNNWEREDHDCGKQESHNRCNRNCRQNNRCCLGLLAGCLFGCRRGW